MKKDAYSGFWKRVAKGNYFFAAGYSTSLDKLLEGLGIPYIISFDGSKPMDIKTTPYESSDFPGTFEKLMGKMTLKRISLSGNKWTVRKKEKENLKLVVKDRGEGAKRLFLKYRDL